LRRLRIAKTSPFWISLNRPTSLISAEPARKRKQANKVKKFKNKNKNFKKNQNQNLHYTYELRWSVKSIELSQIWNKPNGEGKTEVKSENNGVVGR